MSEYEVGLYRIIGEMIREIRNIRKMTLEEIADKLGVTPKTLQRYETGARKIKISTIMELAEIMNFNYDEFMAEAKQRLAGTGDENAIPYYAINEETRKIAQEIFDDKDMKLLFELKKTAKADELMNYAKFLKEQYERENNL
jgi:transcriptional regulator with XRE-family HTH domain